MLLPTAGGLAQHSRRVGRNTGSLEKGRRWGIFGNLLKICLQVRLTDYYLSSPGKGAIKRDRSNGGFCLFCVSVAWLHLLQEKKNDSKAKRSIATVKYRQ